jgi:sugar phosphate isomerase/epimerase
MRFGVAIGEHEKTKSPYLYGGNLSVGFEKARNWGYDAVELHIGDPKKINISEILDASMDKNIDVCGISTGLSLYEDKLILTDQDYERRAAAVQRTKEYIDLSGIIGGCIIIGNMRGSVLPGITAERLETVFAESMKKILDYAAEKGVAIVLEATNRYESNFLNSAGSIKRFIERNGLFDLKIHLDTFHMNIEERNMYDAIIEAKEYLGYFHISDNNRMRPGDGHIDFNAVVNALREIGYTGYIATECLPIPDGESAGKRSLEYIKSMISA